MEIPPKITVFDTQKKWKFNFFLTIFRISIVSKDETKAQVFP